MFGWLKRLFSKGKVSAWQASDKDLDGEVGNTGRVGSHQEQRGDGNSYSGIKMTFKLPEGPKIK